MLSDSTRQAVLAFVAEREWAQFHSEENLAKSISIESAELLECYQWGGEGDRDRVAAELADVVTYCVLLAEKLELDLDEVVLAKLAQSATKYPVEKSKGVSTKYDAL